MKGVGLVPWGVQRAVGLPAGPRAGTLCLESSRPGRPPGGWLAHIPEPQAGACLPGSRLAFITGQRQKEALLPSDGIPVTDAPTELRVTFSLGDNSALGLENPSVELGRPTPPRPAAR